AAIAPSAHRFRHHLVLVAAAVGGGHVSVSRWLSGRWKKDSFSSCSCSVSQPTVKRVSSRAWRHSGHSPSRVSMAAWSAGSSSPSTWAVSLGSFGSKVMGRFSSLESSLGRLAIEKITPERLDPGVDQVADVRNAVAADPADFLIRETVLKLQSQ